MTSNCSIWYIPQFDQDENWERNQLMKVALIAQFCFGFLNILRSLNSSFETWSYQLEYLLIQPLLLPMVATAVAVLVGHRRHIAAFMGVQILMITLGNYGMFYRSTKIVDSDALREFMFRDLPMWVFTTALYAFTQGVIVLLILMVFAYRKVLEQQIEN